MNTHMNTQTVVVIQTPSLFSPLTAALKVQLNFIYTQTNKQITCGQNIPDLHLHLHHHLCQTVEKS